MYYGFRVFLFVLYFLFPYTYYFVFLFSLPCIVIPHLFQFCSNIIVIFWHSLPLVFILFYLSNRFLCLLLGLLRFLQILYYFILLLPVLVCCCFNY
jgi:hypothetical protein